MPARPILPNGPGLIEAARPSARSRAASLLGMLLAALTLLAPLSACATTTGTENTEVAGGAHSAPQAPSESPTAQETTEPATAEPADESSSAEAPDGSSPSSAPAPTTPAPATPAPTAPEPATAEPADGTALAMLAELEEKGRAPKTGYVRDSFGWRDDLDRNGCDTRNDILRRDLDEITLRSGTGGCVVLLGTLPSPYSGESVSFDRTDSTVDIDHVVALSDAWQTGAASWSEDTRREFANDPLNLLAVEASLNRQKGAGDAATWLPPKKDYRCEYVVRQIAVKAKYGLWVKPAEADAMERVLGGCEGFPALADGGDAWPGPGEGDVVATQEQQSRRPAPASTSAPQPAPAEGGGDSSVHYANCDAARSAGAAPVREGDPGYGTHLDRDGDGVGCE